MSPTGRALVLGGGGVTGVAWELGMLAGLADLGVDLAAADLIVGTSAGAAVAAQVSSGADLEMLYDRQLAGTGSEVVAKLGPGTLARFGIAALTTRNPRTARARIGRLALAARTGPESERRAVIASRLVSDRWPDDRRLLITTVDAETGEFAVLDADSGVPLVDAVAASCAVPGVWPPVTFHGRRWIDGGVRSPANADLARHCDQVVVVAPIADGFGTITPLSRQVAVLRRTARVAVVVPDKAARTAAGRNMLDPRRRGAAARAGREQAEAELAAVRDVWAD
jgi:NTE family protein